MKASDLMIGDYVTVTPSGMLIQVAATHKRKVAYHTCADKLSWVREGLLRPIPLTVEILEKNGIRRETDGKIFAEYFEEDDKGLLEISVDSESIWWTVEYMENRILRFNYVHELQHALKLCRIEKEIVL